MHKTTVHSWGMRLISQVAWTVTHQGTRENSRIGARASREKKRIRGCTSTGRRPANPERDGRQGDRFTVTRNDLTAPVATEFQVPGSYLGSVIEDLGGMLRSRASTVVAAAGNDAASEEARRGVS